jgi:hypothetical protein
LQISARTAEAKSHASAVWSSERRQGGRISTQRFCGKARRLISSRACACACPLPSRS